MLHDRPLRTVYRKLLNIASEPPLGEKGQSYSGLPLLLQPRFTEPWAGDWSNEFDYYGEDETSFLRDAEGSDVHVSLSTSDKVCLMSNVGQGSFRPMSGQTVQKKHPMAGMKKFWEDWNKLFEISDEPENLVSEEERPQVELYIGTKGQASVQEQSRRVVIPRWLHDPPVSQFRFTQRINQARCEAQKKEYESQNTASQTAMEEPPVPTSVRGIHEQLWQVLANDARKLSLDQNENFDIDYDIDKAMIELEDFQE
ncbi:hypothetical protein N7462_005631 [Penicillium macrosclerotiorum]|uniref:uncharacterized protein n=1 Tax=Penicillium macrosclerotiorum TaxID=303699 RepID=UPI0025480C42|nr:uncharacterized protein N7462_005631 [Penicillium macrosclerotiorum]KAJ5682466.1 hypothetical protein N7462_005631 [Penicillium macrosclerotiorum]